MFVSVQEAVPSQLGGVGGSPVMCVELNYERHLPPAKLLLADDAIAAACAEMKYTFS